MIIFWILKIQISIHLIGFGLDLDWIIFWILKIQNQIASKVLSWGSNPIFPSLSRPIKTADLSPPRRGPAQVDFGQRSVESTLIEIWPSWPQVRIDLSHLHLRIHTSCPHLRIGLGCCVRGSTWVIPSENQLELTSSKGQPKSSQSEGWLESSPFDGSPESSLFEDRPELSQPKIDPSHSWLRGDLGHHQLNNPNNTYVI